MVARAWPIFRLAAAAQGVLWIAASRRPYDMQYPLWWFHRVVRSEPSVPLPTRIGGVRLDQAAQILGAVGNVEAFAVRSRDGPLGSCWREGEHASAGDAFGRSGRCHPLDLCAWHGPLRFD